MPTPVTSLTLTPGTPIEVGIEDQSGNPLPPAAITWTMSAPLIGVTILPNADGVGFNVLAPAGTTAEAGTITATYTNGVTGTWPVNVAPATVVPPPVTALQLVTLP